MQLFLEVLSGKANSVDLIRLHAPIGVVSSWSALFVYAILSETLVYKDFNRTLFPLNIGTL